jgi:hypothetical protein
MPFVTTPERFGIRKGMLMAVEHALRIKFGEEGLQLLPAISDLDHADKILALHETICKAATLDEVRRACAPVAAPPEPHKKKARRKRQKSEGER